MIIDLPPDSGITHRGPLPELHANSWLEPPVVLQATLAPMNLIQVGAFTGIYGGRVGHSKIGRYCSIAPGVDIASDQHPTNWLSSSMVQYVPDVHGWGAWLKARGEKYVPPPNSFSSNAVATIGNDVWIGQGVFIKSGVAIGDGAIIAAHSVVIADVPAYAIVAGVPARVKRLRFPEATVERLMKVAWWRYNITGVPDIDFRNVDSALELLERSIGEGTLVPYAPAKYGAPKA